MQRDWQSVLNDNIPLARAMQVSAQVQADGSVRLVVPLAPNVNDKGTGFGGSVATLATLAGWVETQRQLDLAGVADTVEIVVQRGQTRYLLPITDEFFAVAEATEPAEAERFIRMFQRRGLSRLAVRIAVRCGDDVCAEFDAEYVAGRA